MKKLIVLLVFLAVFFSVAPRTVELKDRAIVQAIGIDFENGEYSLSVLYYSPSSGGGENSAQTDASASKYISANAPNLDEAFGNISSKTGKINYYGHNNIFVLGADAVKNKFGSIMAYINSSPQLLSDIDLLAAKNTAQEILKAQTDSNILPSQALAKITRSARDNGAIPPDKSVKILSRYLSKDENVLIPTVALKREGEDKYSYNLSGAVVMKDSKFAGVLNNDAVLGYNMLNGTNCKFFVKLKDNSGAVTVGIYSTAAKIDDEETHIYCKSKISDLNPVQSSVTAGQAEKIRNAAQEKIEEICENSFLRFADNAGMNIIYMRGMRSDYNVRVTVKLDSSGAIRAEAG